MSEESYGFENAKTRLEEIVSQVRKKDVSLEKSLDLLEEGVRLANQCVEQIDHADWDAAVESDGDSGEESSADDPRSEDEASDSDSSRGGNEAEEEAATETADESD